MLVEGVVSQSLLRDLTLSVYGSIEEKRSMAMPVMLRSENRVYPQMPDLPPKAASSLGIGTRCRNLLKLYGTRFEERGGAALLGYVHGLACEVWLNAYRHGNCPAAQRFLVKADFAQWETLQVVKAWAVGRPRIGNGADERHSELVERYRGWQAELARASQEPEAAPVVTGVEGQNHSGGE